MKNKIEALKDQINKNLIELRRLYDKLDDDERLELFGLYHGDDLRVQGKMTEVDSSESELVLLDNGKGITKGGRWLGRGPHRDHEALWVPAAYVPELLSLIVGKDPKDRIMSIKENTLRQGLYVDYNIHTALYHVHRLAEYR